MHLGLLQTNCKPTQVLRAADVTTPSSSSRNYLTNSLTVGREGCVGLGQTIPSESLFRVFSQIFCSWAEYFSWELGIDRATGIPEPQRATGVPPFPA
jgi:hypothetical protein